MSGSPSGFLGIRRASSRNWDSPRAARGLTSGLHPQAATATVFLLGALWGVGVVSLSSNIGSGLRVVAIFQGERVCDVMTSAACVMATHAGDVLAGLETAPPGLRRRGLMEQVPASVDAKLQPVPGLREWPAAAPAAAAAALAEPDSTAAATAAAAQVAVAAAALEPGAPATVLAASGQSRAGEPPVRHLHTPWEPLLTRDEVRRGLAYYGSGRRMQRVAAKLLAGRPIKVFTLGGSVTKGSGSSSPAGSYASRLFQLINSTFPHRWVAVGRILCMGRVREGREARPGSWPMEHTALAWCIARPERLAASLQLS